jgi:hypothetical protein
MKRSFLSGGLLLLLFCLTAPVRATPNFSGTWLLDKSQSEIHKRRDVEPAGKDAAAKTPAASDAAAKDAATKTPAEAPAAEEKGEIPFDVKIVVEQSDTQLKVTRSISEGGQERSMTNTYDLSGKEITETGPRGGTMVTKASWDGDKLVVSRTRTRKNRDQEIKIEQKQVWSLSADGKTMTIEASVKGPRREQTRKMVYNKGETKPEATPEAKPETKPGR